MGYDMIDSMKFAANETSKIHAVRTDGQGIETFDTGFFF
jgi:hypothetical protein